MQLIDPPVQPKTSHFAVSVDHVTEPEWNTILPLFADANFYQTWAYGAVCWRQSQLSHVILRRNGEIVAAAQLRIARLPMVRAGVAYLRWGPLWRRSYPDPEVLHAITEAIVNEYARRRGLLLRIVPNAFQEEPVAGLVLEEWSSRGFQAARGALPYRTIRVDLSPTPDQMRKRLDQKWRNQLNSAERNGLNIIEGSDDELFARFLSIYDEMMGRKQFETTVSPPEFRQIQQRLPKDQKMIVLLAEKEGKLMSGIVGSALGDTGIYLLGATSDVGMKSKGSYLLQWRMMQRLKERGCKWYDLGGINPKRNPGVYHFKQGFGGQEVCQLNRVELKGSLLSGFCVGLGDRAQQIKQALSKRFVARKPAMAS
jgi:lipid II:glycine glycyltransferase (peptidoglycan interpeptide bridge formation enzyme)